MSIADKGDSWLNSGHWSWLIRQWDHEINLAEQAPGELNTKAYAMTIKEEETLNKWLDEQLKAGLIVESSSKYALPCFFIPKKDRTLRLVQDYCRISQFQ